MRDGMHLAFVEPMMPTLVAEPPASGDWSTEVKLDGWCVQLAIEGVGVRVFTRRGHDWTSRLTAIAGRVRNLRGEAKLRHALLGRRR